MQQEYYKCFPATSSYFFTVAWAWESISLTILDGMVVLVPALLPTMPINEPFKLRTALPKVSFEFVVTWIRESVLEEMDGVDVPCEIDSYERPDTMPVEAKSPKDIANWPTFT